MATLKVNLTELRRYLKGGRPVSGHDVIVDATIAGDLGAEQLVRLALEVRVNPRTRRSLASVALECRVAVSVRHRWYTLLCDGVYGLYRQLLVLGLPNTAPEQQLMPAGDLNRRLRRSLRSAGVVKVQQAKLVHRGQAAVQQIWDAIRNCNVIVWIDNWYVWITQTRLMIA